MAMGIEIYMHGKVSHRCFQDKLVYETGAHTHGYHIEMSFVFSSKGWSSLRLPCLVYIRYVAPNVTPQLMIVSNGGTVEVFFGGFTEFMHIYATRFEYTRKYCEQIIFTRMDHFFFS